jgi:KaiC/GvpD/RAD55 family RecA-like ATPase
MSATAPPTKTGNALLDAALAYAAMGWRVIPLHTPKATPDGVRCDCGQAGCNSVGKHPRTTHGLDDGTTSERRIRRWWELCPHANVGVVTGPDSGIIALDVDPRNGGDASLRGLEDEWGELPETVLGDTGGGGRHVLFAHPGVKVGTKKNQLAPGLDVKGDGGYVVAPPSLHGSGRRYAWAAGYGPGEAALYEVPGWLLGKITEPEPPPEPGPKLVRFDTAPTRSDAGRYWLAKALARVTVKNRNDTGYWLAQQWRDNGVPRGEADRLILEFVTGCPGGDHPYTEREALRSVASAYALPAREPARGVNYAELIIRANPKPADGKPRDAGAELRDYYERVISGEVYNVPWPWPFLTNLTQALLPGYITVVCGEPGVGKTFFVLQCFQTWYGAGYDPVVFFIEKDRKFHTRRLLAQLEGDGRLIDHGWVHDNPEVVRAALSRHDKLIADLGKFIHSAPEERVTLDSLLGWIRQQASAGRRVIIVDPITAVAAGAERWTKDDDFVIAAQSVCTAHGCSLVVITHPKQSAHRTGRAPSGHDQAGGAAYYRFADTTVWLQRPKKPRDVTFQGMFGVGTGRVPLFFQLHKTRDGTGCGSELAFDFKAMKYVEHGLVLREVAEGEAA